MVSRRALLRSIGLSSTATLAGCSGLFWSGERETETPSGQHGTPTTTPTATLSPTATSAQSRTEESSPTSTPTTGVPEASETPAFTPTAGDRPDEFGTSVALSEDVALLSVDDQRVYVFEQTGGGWRRTSVLTPEDGDEFADQPVAMVLVGETAFVGAPDSASDGVVAVFERIDGDWNRRTTLTPEDDENEYHDFGRSVACNGETLVVGAVRPPSTMAEYSGTVFVFERSDTEWAQRASFETDPDVYTDLFGQRVALSGDSVVVGAPSAPVDGESRAGKAFVYERSESTWKRTTELTAADVDGSPEFGQTLAVDGDTLVVGAPGADGDTGDVYIFERGDGGWEERTRVSGFGRFDYDEGLSSVALLGDTLLVGNPDESESGRVSRFERTEDGWERTAVLAPDDPDPEDDFGTSVALAESTALVGAPAEAADRRGRGYLFTL